MNAIKVAAEERYSVASKAMRVFPKGPMGLTPDSVKATAEWKQAKAEYNAAFAHLRKVNSIINSLKA